MGKAWEKGCLFALLLLLFLSQEKALEEGKTPRACSTGLCREKRVSNSAGLGEKALPVI